MKWHVLWELGKKYFYFYFINYFLFSPAHANKLVNQEKIKSIEELRSHPKLNQLLNKTQQLGLKYLEEFEQKIPRDEMKQMEVDFY